MTLKDYERIARALRRSHPAPWEPAQRAQWRITRELIADELADDNPRFDRAKFYAATEEV